MGIWCLSIVKWVCSGWVLFQVKCWDDSSPESGTHLYCTQIADPKKPWANANSSIKQLEARVICYMARTQPTFVPTKPQVGVFPYFTQGFLPTVTVFILVSHLVGIGCLHGHLSHERVQERCLELFIPVPRTKVVLSMCLIKTRKNKQSF